MTTRLWRSLGASVVLGAMFVLFLPIVYDARLIPCGLGTGCPTNETGLRSIANVLFGWGGTYSFGYGAASPFNGYFVPTTANPWPTGAVLLMVILPLVVALVGLLAHEIVGVSRTTRFGLVGFGALVAMLSGLAVVTTTPRPFLAELIFLPMAWAGGLIVLYGTRLWIFNPTGQVVDTESPGDY